MPSDPRRLLVITYHFPPDASVGGLRWAGLSKCLARLGWKLCVLTAAPPLGREAIEGVRVEGCARAQTVNDVYRRFRRGGSAPASPGQAAEGQRPPSAWRQLRRELAAGLALPDQARGWIVRATLRARSLLREFQPHVLVSSGPPHSAHLVARMARIGHPVRWLIDLRDPWAGPVTRAWRSDPLHETRAARLLTPRLERLAFKAADGLVVTTPQLADKLAARYPGLPVACVQNGVDPERLPAPCPDPYRGLGIAYAGTLYGNRDLGPVFRALRLFVQRYPEAARAGAKLRIAGHADGTSSSALRDDIASLQIEPYVEILGPLPPPQALSLTCRSRLAVVLAQDADLQIPSKLYESIAMRVPTLVVAPRDSAAGIQGARLGAFVLDSSDIEGIARLLEGLWRNEQRLAPEPRVPITYEEIAPLMERVLMPDARRGPLAIGQPGHPATGPV